MMKQSQYQERKSVIAFDFDGVIHRYSKKWYDGTIYDEPIKGSQEALRQLSNKYKVVIVTSRTPIKDIKQWLSFWDFDEYEVTNQKIPALAYIDDRAIRFEGNWDTILNYFV